MTRCQRCSNALAHAPKGQRQMVAALIRTVFAQDTEVDPRRQWHAVANQLQAKFPKIAKPMDEAETDVLAFMTFPKAHRLQIHSTNPLGRCNP